MSAIAARPESQAAAPSGLYWLDGMLRVRRFAPAHQELIRCPYHHEPIKIHDRPIAATPQCAHRDAIDPHTRCAAHFWVYRMDRNWLLVLDVNADEVELIQHERMDLPDVIAFFGLHMPGAK